jgi:NAD(P)-dependent dehydrogenase (short-subunit alcohol dehydrogenase family)
MDEHLFDHPILPCRHRQGSGRDPPPRTSAVQPVPRLRAMTDFQGRSVLVTGAASGIGRACVERLLGDGAVVVGADVVDRPADLAPDSDRFGYRTVDVRDEAAVEAAVAACVERTGRIDGVVTAAGVAGGGAVHDLPVEEWDRIIAVNLTGTFLTARHAIARMLGQEPVGGGDRPGERGAIVTLASIEGLEGTAGGSAYNASKGGVVLLTKNLAIDYGRQGIRANAICPGFIETEMSGGPGAGERFPQMIQATGLKRAGQPEEVAELACFLASDRASYISGAIIPIDGGSTARLA